MSTNVQLTNLGTEDTTSVTRSASCTSPLSTLDSNLLVWLLAAVTKENASIITTAILSNKNLVDAVTNAVTGIINKECSVLCRHSTDNRSPFRKVFVPDMSSFQWKNFIEELSTNAPTLSFILSSLVSHSDHCNKRKADAAHHPGLCTIVALLLKRKELSNVWYSILYLSSSLPITR